MDTDIYSVLGDEYLVRDEASTHSILVSELVSVKPAGRLRSAVGLKPGEPTADREEERCSPTYNIGWVLLTCNGDRTIRQSVMRLHLPPD
jgi:hypothetical protein